MSFKQLLTAATPIFLSLYLGIWLGCIVPSLINSEIINYTVVGLFLFLLLTSTSLVFFTNFWTRRYLNYLISGINLSSILLTFVTQNMPIFIFAALAQGLLAGVLLKPILLSHNIDKNIFAKTALGTALVALVILTNTLAPDNIVAIGCMSILVLLLALTSTKSTELFHSNEKAASIPKFLNVNLLLLSGVLIAIEISFIMWSLILKDDSQNIFHRFAFFITFALVFVFRKNSSQLINKLSDIGWIFILTLLLTLSLGLFYTFSFPILFIVCFAFALAYLFESVLNNYKFRLSALHISIILFGVALLNLIFGLFVQNHIEFIISIKIPENVLALSARQAVVKELASGGAILVVLAGIIFLFRRRWVLTKA